MKYICLLIILFSSALNASVLFQTPPREFNPKVEVAICFIETENKVLFLKRQQNKPEGGTWAVPGGKLDKGESALQAVIREISEETHLTLMPDQTRYLGKLYARVPKCDFILHVFATELMDTDRVVQLNPKEHEAFQWVTLEKSLQLPLIIGEDECISYYYHIS